MYHWKFLEPMVTTQFTTIYSINSHYIHQLRLKVMNVMFTMFMIILFLHKHAVISTQ
jgi:hypothetical protein